MTADSTQLREQLQHSLGSAYTLDRELGGGGMARVFAADENALGRRVVVKVPPVETLSPLAVDRFKREITLAARLNHPHIVPLLSAGEMDGVPYYTMPFVEGESLRARLARTGEVAVADVVQILRHVASALAFAHAKGIVHRDVKPENILLTGEHALVVDFGVAKALSAATQGDTEHLTTIGIAVGTPAYMAPEQAAADPAIDHRADLYALGVVAYEMLTGHAPFAGRSAQALLAAQMVESPEPIARHRPAVPVLLAALVMRCLRKQPGDRPQSADEIVRQLDALRLSSSRELGDRPSLAVLPMVNLSDDPDNEHFSDGLTDELIGALGQLEELAVSGRTSVFALKGKGLDVRAIADTLGVANVLEGSVRRSGMRLKVRVQLVNADGMVLWSAAYDRLITDVFEVQEEIAQAVVHALEVRFGAARQPVRPATDDVTAYDLFLRGVFVRRRLNPGDLERAIGYFEQAVARDPRFARAYAWLADAHTLLAVFAGRPVLEVLPIARAYARRAVELDNDLADAHWATGHVAMTLEWDNVAGPREMQHALALDPGHVDARLMHGIWLMFQRQFEKAEAELRRALAVDPLLATAHMTLGQNCVAIGQADRAISHLQDALELSPGLSYAREQLAHAYIQLRRYDEAIAECERAAASGGAREVAMLAYALAAGGRHAEASRIVSKLAEAERGYAAPAHIAMAYTALGNTEAALSWLERAVAERDLHLYGFDFRDEFQPLRADPRFMALVREMGLGS